MTNPGVLQALPGARGALATCTGALPGTAPLTREVARAERVVAMAAPTAVPVPVEELLPVAAALPCRLLSAESMVVPAAGGKLRAGAAGAAPEDELLGLAPTASSACMAPRTEDVRAGG